MSVVKIIADNTTIEFDKELIVKYSSKIANEIKDKDTVNLEISLNHIKYIKEYVDHHKNKETLAPLPPLQQTWTIDNAYEDAWDKNFIKTILTSEGKMPNKFCSALEHLNMDNLLKKVTLGIALNLIQNKGNDPDVIAKEISKLAL